MARDMGPNSDLPSVKAGGAVAEPLASIWNVTLGCSFLKPSDHMFMTLASVSEPMLMTVPDTSTLFS